MDAGGCLPEPPPPGALRCCQCDVQCADQLLELQRVATDAALYGVSARRKAQPRDILRVSGLLAKRGAD